MVESRDLWGMWRKKSKWLGRGEEGDSDGAGHGQRAGRQEALVRIRETCSLGFINKRPPPRGSLLVSYSLPGLIAYSLRVEFPTVLSFLLFLALDWAWDVT